MRDTCSAMEGKFKSRRIRKATQWSHWKKMWKTVIVISILWLALVRKSGASFNALNTKHIVLTHLRKAGKPTPPPASHRILQKTLPTESPSMNASKTYSSCDLPFLSSHIIYSSSHITFVPYIYFSISMHQICDGYNPRVRMGNSSLMQAIGWKKATQSHSPHVIAPKSRSDLPRSKSAI